MAVALAPTGYGASRFDAKRAAFSVKFKNELADYRDLSVFVMPATKLTIEAIAGPQAQFEFDASEGDVARSGLRRWRWTAPLKAGHYRLRMKPVSGEARDDITLHAFVLVPADQVKEGRLNGYRIGEYPTPSNGRASALYQPPDGFIEVTEELADTPVSPHFRLKQFLCKQDTPDRYPKYLVLQERLPLTLESILERVNALGFEADTLHVMSGYRTPFYNHAIGDVRFSMHQWGGAADVYVDRDGKSVMDDLTRDGRVDIQDAELLYDIVERMLAVPELRLFQGGLGVYPSTMAHPPFVHVDVRGTKARWRG